MKTTIATTLQSKLLGLHRHEGDRKMKTFAEIAPTVLASGVKEKDINDKIEAPKKEEKTEVEIVPTKDQVNTIADAVLVCGFAKYNGIDGLSLSVGLPRETTRKVIKELKEWKQQVVANEPKELEDLETEALRVK